MKNILRLFLFLAAYFLTANSFSQGLVNRSDTLSKKETDSLVIHYCSVLKEHYFDKPKANEIEKILMKKLKNKEFYEVPAKHLTDKLSLLLRDITHDLHFYIGIQEPTPTQTDDGTREEQLSEEPKNHFSGFTEIKLLENNIGYIKWTEFIADDQSFQKLVAALTFLEGCDHLIFDISHCPGGDGRMGGFVNHHLYESPDYQDVLLKKCGGENEWHQSEVPYNYSNGPKFFDIPVYIIISKNTASSAEYFALIAQETKRATILGETTAGAGNPVIMIPFDTYFAYVPVCEIKTAGGKSIEGKGVVPDVQLKSDHWIEETVKYILKE
ncbi:S41 family peptidase [uncultured Fluviicola sp.]|uniref:S41 family peptidase n=1 Tax=uncultured Fluviicola sp. TaxID=463303 RepID=UPI0025D417EC|nr:S41 family peptidase [uncultured Fluviicola sp.]